MNGNAAARSPYENHGNRLRPAIVCLCVALWACHDSHHSHDAADELLSEPAFIPLHAEYIAEDINPDPGIVEVNLTAMEADIDLGTGTLTRLLTYNGSMPGPVIEAEVGNTLIVNFTNNTDLATVVHWHGLENVANMDGSSISQPPIASGETFRYEMPLNNAALFWYHSHIKGRIQVERGLQGTLLVRDPEEVERLGLPEREHVLVLDDILLDENFQVAGDSDDTMVQAMRMLNGRLGNHFMVNGKIGDSVQLEAGVPHRLRLVNTSNSRFMRIAIPGPTVYQIGGDGGLLAAPRIIAPIETSADPADPSRQISNPDVNQGLLLTPAERADLVFTPQGSDPIVIEWHDFPRGRREVVETSIDDPSLFRFSPEDDLNGDGLTYKEVISEDDGAAAPVTLLTINPIDDTGNIPYEPPSILRDITPIDRVSALAANMVVRIDLGGTRVNDAGESTFFTTTVPNVGQCEPPFVLRCAVPFKEMTSASAPAGRPGETWVWEVRNPMTMDHNFHLHGFFFQPYEIEVRDLANPERSAVTPIDDIEWKDTVRLPRRPGDAMGSQTIVRFAVTYTDEGREGKILAAGKVPTATDSGGWLFHCHILEHAELGMTGYLEIFDQ